MRVCVLTILANEESKVSTRHQRFSVEQAVLSDIESSSPHEPVPFLLFACHKKKTLLLLETTIKSMNNKLEKSINSC